MAMEGSAISAMGMLRGQIEERLLQTEDYRALKALDKAIAEVRHPSAGKLGVGPAPVEIGENHNLLQQKVAEKFNSAAA